MVEGGATAVTTRAVANRASVPVATLYQFFANRDALLEELFLRVIDLLDEEIADKLATVDARTIPEAVEQIFEIHRAHYRADSGLVSLYYAGRESGRFVEMRTHRERLADLVHTALLDRGLLRADTDPLVGRVAIELGDRIIELAYRSAPEGDAAIIAEGKLALIRYLDAYSTNR